MRNHELSMRDFLPDRILLLYTNTPEDDNYHVVIFNAAGGHCPQP